MSIDLNAINTKLEQLNSITSLENFKINSENIRARFTSSIASKLGGRINEVISGVKALSTAGAGPQISIFTEELTGMQDKIIGNITSSAGDLSSILGGNVDNGFLNVVISAPTSEGVSASLKSILGASDTEVRNIVSQIVPDNPDTDIESILNFNIKEEFSAITSQFKSSFSGILKQLENPLQSVINSIDSQLTGSISEQISGMTGIESTSAAETTTDNDWDGAETAGNFTTVDSNEELAIEFNRVTREITEMIIFGYESQVGQNLSASSIHSFQSAAGINGIGFHYVIMSDGTLERGRPINTVGEHITSHNDYSIAVVLPALGNGNITSKQAATLQIMVGSFYDKWPGGRLWSATELAPEAYSLGININDYRDRYGKLNYGSSESSISTETLISASVEGI